MHYIQYGCHRGMALIGCSFFYLRVARPCVVGSCSELSTAPRTLVGNDSVDSHQYYYYIWAGYGTNCYFFNNSERTILKRRNGENKNRKSCDSLHSDWFYFCGDCVYHTQLARNRREIRLSQVSKNW